MPRRQPTDGHQPAPAANSTSEQAVVTEFVRAYESGDVDGLVALLTTDIFVSMPPIPLEYRGVDVVSRLFAAIFGSGRRVDLVPTRANGQPAFGAYLRASTGLRHGSGFFVLTLPAVRNRPVHALDQARVPMVRSPRC